MGEKSKFEDYLLCEYSNIAQAHFKSIETTSTFFRYYLLIMSIPVSAIAILSQIGPKEAQSIAIIQQYKLPASILLFCVSAIGLGVFCYIINLRLDTILYARVVNSMRKYFYDKSNLAMNVRSQMRVLPESPQLPQYFETSFFLPVVLVFAIMNGLYACAGLYILLVPWPYLLLVVSSLLLHFGIYRLYAKHRETAYLKSNILGIDIDGVLNKHRENFCSLLREKVGKKIEPDKITIVPVHEHPSMGITREDERKIFNDPRYWADMDIIEDSAETIRRLSNIFGLKICIFTYRPWPDAETKSELRKYRKEFLNRCACVSLKYKILKRIDASKIDPLKQITKEWLRKHNVLYDKLVFEKGNDYSSDPRGKFKNRFYQARKKRIRFFAEDELEKAIKLSYICDIVFLFDQPYNRERAGIPSNVIPVTSWDQIFREIRKFS